MNTEEFNKKAKEEVRKFAEASKNALEKAGDKVQKFTDETVTKVEKNQLERKRAGKYEELGCKLSALLLNGAEIKCADEDSLSELLKIQEEIKDFTVQIKEKDDSLNK